MSVPANFDYSIKDISSASFVQIEGNMSGKEELDATFVSMKTFEKNNQTAENSEFLKEESHKETEEDCVLHEVVKPEASFQYYTNNLEESQKDPLAIYYINTENIKNEYSNIEDIKDIKDVQQDFITDVQKDCKLEDTKYNNGTAQQRVESSLDNDHTVKGVHKDSIQGRSSIERDRISVTGHEVIKQVKSYKCNDCYKEFSQSGNLKKHVDNVHKGIKKHECEDCHKMFSTAQKIKRHIDSVHKGIKKHKCNDCQKLFSSARYLKIHIDKVHKGVKDYECNHCHKVFSFAQNLKMHIDSVHKGIKKYKCNECHKIFTQAGSLRTHIDSVHKRIKKYECNECNKMFSQVGSLKKHIFRMHKEKKNYECSFCHKFHSNKYAINNYSTGIQNYECNQ